MRCSPLLAGDIGGTKTLLATYRVEGARLVQERCSRYSSAEWDDFAALVAHFLDGGEAVDSVALSSNNPWALWALGGCVFAGCGGVVEDLTDSIGVKLPVHNSCR